jgi:hypothetical protein
VHPGRKEERKGLDQKKKRANQGLAYSLLQGGRKLLPEMGVAVERPVCLPEWTCKCNVPWVEREVDLSKLNQRRGFNGVP